MLNVLSLFSGIGAFERALENLGIAYKLVGYCEIDKYASKAYSLLHRVPESMNYGDIIHEPGACIICTDPYVETKCPWCGDTVDEPLNSVGLINLMRGVQIRCVGEEG